jgi:putative ABC transport system permease protein
MFTENVRGAYRSLRSAPGFTLTVVLSLGIGIGGSVAMFTLVNSILLKPLVYNEAGQLVLVTNLTPKVAAIPVTGLVPLQYIRWRKEIQSFSSFALVRRAATLNLTGSGPPETLGVMRITSTFFDTLRVAPQRGRWFTESEEKRGAPNVAVVSDSVWRRRFSADPEIIGKKILLNDVAHEIVGIAPPDLRLFRGRQLHPQLEMPERTDIFLPIRFREEEEQGFYPYYVAIARLKPGVTLEQARAELDSTLPTFRSPFLKEMNTRVGVQPLQTALVGNLRKSLLVLLFSVGFVLLIVCANVANLSLVRANRRCRELAIRVALGAGKVNLIGLLLTESFLLALGGTAVGSILSMWIIDVVISLASVQIPRLEETAADVNVFAFAIAVCALTTILSGLLPAWRASRVDPQHALNAAGRTKTETLRGGRIRATLVGAEVALGTVLVIGSGLLLISFHHVMNTPRGFDGHDILMADLVLPSPRYQAVEKQISFFRALRDTIASIPGAMNVAANTRLPLGFEDHDAVTREGEETLCSDSAGCRMGSSGQLPLTVVWPSVSSEYFVAMRIPLRAGRLFRNDGETERVAVISESVARILWPTENPLGKRLIRPFENPGVYWRVVGIVGDVRSGGLDRDPTPLIYRSYEQRGGGVFSLVVRTSIAPDALAKAVREAVGRVDADIPVPEIRTMPATIARSVQQRRFQASLLGAFALVAVLLAAIGIYGVVAYSVLQRRKEIGVRLALGASQPDLRRLILKNGMVPVFAGLGAGLLAASLLARLIASLLFEVGTLDPLTFIGAPLILVLAAAIPCWLNARQASQIDPMDALRFD